MLATGKPEGSPESSRKSSALSTPRRLSIHPSVTWGGSELETDLPSPQEQPIQLQIPTRLPGLLSKAGRLCSSHKYLIKTTDSTDEVRTKQVEELINYDHLRKLERMFREADIDGGGGLDMEEFRKAMKKIMGDISEEDIDVIFMKVDTNCDGSVDWVTNSSTFGIQKLGGGGSGNGDGETETSSFGESSSHRFLQDEHKMNTRT